MADEKLFCPRCGAETKKGQNFCIVCGFGLSGGAIGSTRFQHGIQQTHEHYQKRYSRPYQSPPVRKNDGVCIAALTCGILLPLAPMSSIPAIILGIIGIKRTNRNPKYLTGKGLGIAGLVLGIIGTLVALIGLLLMASITSNLKYFHATDREQHMQTSRITLDDERAVRDSDHLGTVRIQEAVKEGETTYKLAGGLQVEETSEVIFGTTKTSKGDHEAMAGLGILVEKCRQKLHVPGKKEPQREPGKNRE